jgi:hypothetical protein
MTDFNLIFRIKVNDINLNISFCLLDDIFNLSTNEFETEVKTIDSKLIKRHNKQLLKVSFSYQAFVDPSMEMYLYKLTDENIVLPDVEIKIRYKEFALIFANWAKFTYSKIKSLIISDIKSIYYVQYIYKIIENSQKEKYKKASPKQLLGNPIAYFNRNCKQNLTVEYFNTHTFEQCRQFLRNDKFSFYIDKEIKKLLQQCRNKALNIYCLDLESLIMGI